MPRSTLTIAHDFFILSSVQTKISQRIVCRGKRAKGWRQADETELMSTAGTVLNSNTVWFFLNKDCSSQETASDWKEKKIINLPEMEFITILPTLSKSYWEAVKNGLLISKSLLSRALYPTPPWSPGWNRITNLCPCRTKLKKHPGNCRLCVLLLGVTAGMQTQHNVTTLSPHHRWGAIHF